MLVAALALGGCGAGGLPPLPTGTGPATTESELSTEQAGEFRSAAAELDGLEQRLVACTDIDPSRCPQAVHDAGRIAARLRDDVTPETYTRPGGVLLLESLNRFDEDLAEASPVCGGDHVDAQACAGKVHSIIFGVRVMGSHVEMLLK